jgi:hypothetical protein
VASSRIFSSIKITVYLAVLFASFALPSQTPVRPGKLQIDSNPNGANITINGKVIDQKTPVSLVVAPGEYTVTISGKSGAPNCQPNTFKVNSGDTTECYCSGTTWQPKPQY